MCSVVVVVMRSGDDLVVVVVMMMMMIQVGAVESWAADMSSADAEYANWQTKTNQGSSYLLETMPEWRV